MEKSKECAWCKATFTAKHGLNNRKFCSKSCNVSMNNSTRIWSEPSKQKLRDRIARDGYSGTKNPNFRNSRKDCVCLECGKNFWITTYSKKGGKFCNKSCYYKHISKNKGVGGLSKIEIKIHSNLSRSIRHSLKSDKGKQSWTSILGYSVDDLKTHLERLFKDGMNWDNYGVFGWHIDHIKPVSCFRFNSVNDVRFLECWALSNLQPLWAKDNWEKGDMRNKHAWKYEMPSNKNEI